MSRHAAYQLGDLHVSYPHEPGRLYDCPACEGACHCGPAVHRGEETECIWSGHNHTPPPRHAAPYTDVAGRRDEVRSLFPAFEPTPRHRSDRTEVPR